jgi:hypothetical protein
MALVLSSASISSGETIRAGHVTQSIKALTGAEAYDITISGSLTVIGSTNISGSVDISQSLTVGETLTVGELEITNLTVNGIADITTANIDSGIISASFTGSLLGTASYVTGSSVYGPNGSNSILTASFATTASFVRNALTASFVQNAVSASYVLNAVSASFASTASYVTGSIFTGNNLALSSSFASTASFVQNAQTASYVLNAVSASFASTASNTPNALITASVSSNTITFTKGNGSTFPITINTGSGGSTAAGNNYEVQYNIGGVFDASNGFRFIPAPSFSLEIGIQNSNNAKGIGSFVGGFSTVASRSYQTAVGQLNEQDNLTSLFVVGGGTISDNSRKDAFSVDQDPDSLYCYMVIPNSLGSPATIKTGSMYYDIGDGKIYVWNGSVWKSFTPDP